MGKKQIEWRKPDADVNLYLAHFRLGYQLKIHLIQHGQMQKEWQIFVDQIFLQDGFIGSEASVSSIQTQ